MVRDEQKGEKKLSNDSTLYRMSIDDDDHQISRKSLAIQSVSGGPS